MLETDICKHTALTTKRKIIYFVAIGVGVFCFFALLALGLINKSPVTSQSGVTRVGKVAPGFEMPLIKGGDFVMADHTGRPMIVNFWASWCPPCRDESPGFERTWRQYSHTEVLFVGVDIQDTVEDGLAYVESFDLTYPNGTDLDGKITVDYGVIGLPVTFFIGTDGVVKGRWVGALPENELITWVEDLIAGDAPAEAREREN